MSEHISVLLKESVDYLITDPNGIYIDGTFGRGGHTKAILEKLGENGKLIAIDKDLSAIGIAKKLKENLEYKNKFDYYHGSFADIENCLKHFDISEISGIIYDFGVSSPQLDEAERGFSFSKDGPLDMRMNQSSGVKSAKEWLQYVSHEELSNVLFNFGDEKYSRKIATAIINYRDEGNELNSTAKLAEIIKKAHPRWPKNIHPATKSFQAIRIHINNELNDIEQALPLSFKYLKSSGRMVFISFHSLEDRMVKKFIKDNLRPFHDIPKEIPVLAKDMEPKIMLLNKGNKKPSSQEVDDNIRSRSAVMRVIEKI